MFLDVSSNQVTFRILQNWISNYENPTSSEYLNLTERIVAEVRDICWNTFLILLSDIKRR